MIFFFMEQVFMRYATKGDGRQNRATENERLGISCGHEPQTVSISGAGVAVHPWRPRRDERASRGISLHQPVREVVSYRGLFTAG